MARQVYTYVVLGVGITLLLFMAGLIPDGASPVLNFVLGTAGLDITDISATSYFTLIAAIFSGVGIATLAVGFLLNRNAESFLIFGLVGGILTIFFPMWYNIIKLNTYADWTTNVMLLIFIPYTIGFGLAIINYWRGSD